MKPSTLLPLSLLAAISRASPLKPHTYPSPTPTSTLPPPTTTPSNDGITIIPLGPTPTPSSLLPQITIESLHDPGELFTVIETVTKRALHPAAAMAPSGGVVVKGEFDGSVTVTPSSTVGAEATGIVAFLSTSSGSVAPKETKKAASG